MHVLPDEALVEALIVTIGLNLTYSMILLTYGPTPSHRASGISHLYDTICLAIVYTCLVIIHTNMYTILSRLCNMLGIELQAHDIDVGVTHARQFFDDLFQKLVSVQRGLLATVCALTYSIVGAPVASYLTHVTQYFQWMCHWATINTYLYRYLAELASYHNTLFLVGMFLSFIPPTRPVGAVIASLGFTLPPYIVAFYSWCVKLDLMSVAISGEELHVNQDITRTFTEIFDIVLGGYNLGQKLQTFNITADLGLTIMCIVVYGLARMIDKSVHIVKIA